MTTYAPPSGKSVTLDFRVAYVAVPGNRVELNFSDGEAPPPGDDQYLFPGGWASLVIGQHIARNESETLRPAGWNSLAITELHKVWNATFQAFPTGIAPGAAGRPTVYNQDQEVRPSGLNAFRGFGAHWVSLGTRRISAAGLGVQTRFGNAQMAGGKRWLDLAGRGINAIAWGRPTVWFHTRELFPQWFVATRYGNPLVDFNHDVLPDGIAPGMFGAHEVHRPRFLVDLQQHGIAGPLWGDHRVDNFIQHIRPQGFITAPTEHERFGRAEAWLWTRYVVQQFEVTPSDGGVFGNFNYVDNRDKYPRPEGIAPPPFGVAEVRNNARLIRTPPHQEHTLWGDNMVSHSVRYLRAHGTDTSLWGSPLGTIVYNGARVLAPKGWGSAVVQDPARVWSNLQRLTYAGGIDSLAIGQHMVAFRVRTIVQAPYPEPPRLGYGSVQLAMRFLVPAGIGSARYGVPTVEERFTIIAPASIRPPAGQVGDSARVWNMTPEIRTMGAVATQWGAARVFNQFERYAFQGFDGLAFGRHVVRDRRQRVSPPGINSLQIPLRHQVRNVIPDPPPPQTIAAPGLSSMRIGSHRVQSNSIRPAGEVHVRWGVPRLVSMGIRPEGITPPYDPATGSQFGIPDLPGQQHIRPAGLYATLFGSLNTWPHYIWAPKGYPYPVGEGDRGHIMDYAVHGHDHPERPVFGRAEVTNRNRTVTPHGWSSLVMVIQDHRVSTNPQYVRPDGTRHIRFGFPVVNGGGKVRPHGFDHLAMGNPVVVIADYGDRIARPAGINAFGPGRPEVSHFHRQVSPQGWVEFQVSAPRPPAWPRTSHWVSNAYPPFPAFGADMSAFGTAWVSHLHRPVAPAGWDSFVSEYTPGWFNVRMRVSRRGRVTGAGAGIGTLFGMAELSQRVRYLQPRPIYAPVWPRPAVRPVTMIGPAGWDSLVLGNVDRWEAGTVKPHGDDLAAYGRAIIHRALHPEGFAGTMGQPRIGAAIGPAGFDHSSTGKPATIARWCGNKALAAQGTSAGTIGTPHIAQVTP